MGAARSTALGSASGLLVLVTLGPAPSTALAQLRSASSAADPTAPLVAAVALTAWALALWLALTVVLVLVARLPGHVGRASALVARRVAPATVRRTVEVALGITVTVGALAAPATAATAAAAAPAAGGAPSGSPVASAGTVPDLDWPDGRTAARVSAAPDPSAPVGAGVAPVPPTTPAAAPARQRATATPPAATGQPRGSVPASDATARRTAQEGTAARTRRARAEAAGTAEAPAPADLTAPPTTDRAVSPQPTAAAAPVVVRPGDTLWDLAEASLQRAGTAAPSDAQVAQAWPRWWAANRDVIGDDPDLIRPGTVLRPPDAPAPTR